MKSVQCTLTFTPLTAATASKPTYEAWDSEPLVLWKLEIVIIRSRNPLLSSDPPFYPLIRIWITLFGFLRNGWISWTKLKSYLQLCGTKKRQHSTKETNINHYVISEKLGDLFCKIDITSLKFSNWKTYGYKCVCLFSHSTLCKSVIVQRIPKNPEKYRKIGRSRGKPRAALQGYTEKCAETKNLIVLIIIRIYIGLCN